METSTVGGGGGNRQTLGAKKEIKSKKGNKRARKEIKVFYSIRRWLCSLIIICTQIQ